MLKKIILNCLIACGLPFILLSTGCLPFKYSYKSKDQSVSMNVINDTIIKYEEMKPQLASRGTADIIGKALSLCSLGIKKLIEMDRAKYTAEYAGAGVNNYFYYMPSARGSIDPSGMQFAGVEFLRTVKVKKVVDTAIFFRLVVDRENPYDIANNSVFKMKLDKIIIKYAKAKIPGSRWYLPWTWVYRNSKKNTLNLDVDIAFNADWITEEQVMNKKVEVGRFAFSLRDAPLDPELPNYRQYYKNLEGTPISGYSYIVPRSFGYYVDGTNSTSPCWGQGMYDIIIHAKEAGKEKMVTKLIFDNSDAIIDGIQQKLTPSAE
jgi:hypothetical protein